METKKLSQFEVITFFIGEITLFSADIERCMNDIISSFFITDSKKKILFNRWLLYRNGFKFKDKIECLNFIADSVNDKLSKGILETTIMFAMRFDIVKNNLSYGGICFSDEQENVAINIVSDMYRYKRIEITPEYMEIARDTAISTIEGLKNAMNLIHGAEQAN